MNKRVDTIIEEVRKLSATEREELLARLPLELDRHAATSKPSGPTGSSVRDLARERADEIDRGTVQLVPWDEVRAGLD